MSDVLYRDTFAKIEIKKDNGDKGKADTEIQHGDPRATTTIFASFTIQPPIF